MSRRLGGVSLAVGLIACLFASRSDGSEGPAAARDTTQEDRRVPTDRMAQGLGVLGPTVAKAASRPERRGVRLFSIGRNLNGNRVAYDVEIGPDGRFDTDQPIDVYWLLEKGGTEPLSGLERKKAYGAEVHVATPDVVRFTIKPLPTRMIDVRREGNGIVATTSIAGEPAEIEDIFVQAGGGLLPKVDYVEIRGRSLADGKERRERITP